MLGDLTTVTIAGKRLANLCCEFVYLCIKKLLLRTDTIPLSRLFKQTALIFDIQSLIIVCLHIIFFWLIIFSCRSLLNLHHPILIPFSLYYHFSPNILLFLCISIVYHINFASPVASSTSSILNLYHMSFPFKSAPFDAMIVWKYLSISRHSNSPSVFSLNSSSRFLPFSFIPWTSCETVSKNNFNLLWLLGKSISNFCLFAYHILQQIISFQSLSNLHRLIPVLLYYHFYQTYYSSCALVLYNISNLLHLLPHLLHPIWICTIYIYVCFPIKSAPFGAMIAWKFVLSISRNLNSSSVFPLHSSSRFLPFSFIPWTPCETVSKVNLNLLCLMGKFTLGTVGIVCL